YRSCRWPFCWLTRGPAPCGHRGPPGGGGDGMTQPAGTAVSCRGVRKRFEGVDAVAGVDLEVQAGELLCLLGPSGCGKTTLLRLMAGLERQDDGRIEIAGRLVAGPGVHMPPEARR